MRLIVPSKLSLASFIVAIIVLILSLATIILDIILVVFNLANWIVVLALAVLALLLFVFGLLSIIIMWFQLKKEDKEKMEEEERRKKEEERRKKEEEKRRKEEERTTRPQIHFDIYNREMDTIGDYPFYSDFYIINSTKYNPILKPKFKVLHNEKTIQEFHYKNSIEENAHQSVEELFPDKGTYTFIMYFESKAGFKYFTGTQVECKDDKGFKYRKVIRGSQEWYIKDEEGNWKEITNQVKRELIANG